MANDVNNNTHYTTPEAIITMAIDATPTGENNTLFNLSNPPTTTKAWCHKNTQNYNRPKIQTQPNKKTPNTLEREESQENERITGDIFNPFK